ncbi:protein of unknown function DUF1003 [Catenulispora acidiphila DSM 44928]|uniref:Integral membrane protein n=1 Tax=Catenulispora acidiphila (strain DSM 44928 / JCM 14897 / NBRC 102108 / NRRL B-24433 / ID139908) TaxID=479433 RepID=C7QHD7_CATAD|nr:DUF1003 domain-containing protein [Catenulispora acidiphila]ACU69076.1 protein of unknown function DUF1003 [Catenulispora acidiphila DSM 44928]
MAREYIPPRLDQPRGRRQVSLKPSFDPDAFGRVSETIARFFGTARYLFIQSLIVVIWIALNILVVTKAIRWDPYPFILLNLAFSTQAAYAAPLILLAQNRQAERDKVQIAEDKAREELSFATMEYLTREIASLRMAVGEVATRDYVRGELQSLLKELDERGRDYSGE